VARAVTVGQAVWEEPAAPEETLSPAPGAAAMAVPARMAEAAAAAAAAPAARAGVLRRI
jgi:hypothetical protein